MNSSPFAVAMERTMGSQCTTCKGTGFVNDAIPSHGSIKVGQLYRRPCPNPACTVGKAAKKLTRADFTKLQREDRVLGSVRALVSVMPELSVAWEFSHTIELTDVKASDVLDEIFEAAHQMVDDGYQKMKCHSVTVDGTEYSFKVSEQPECGRLTTERKVTVTEDEKALRAVPFDDEPKLDDVFPRDADGKPIDAQQTINPDLPTSPVAPTEKPAESKTDEIAALKLLLYKRLQSAFNTESKEQITDRLKVALKASDFQDFILKYPNVKDAQQHGETMVDLYIEANMPVQAPEPSSSPAVAGDPFQPATDDGVYLKMAIAGPSGSGKSFTSLKIAREMFPEGKVAFLCTEHKAARRYAKHFKFNLMEIADYHPQRFIDAIHAAEQFGYDVLIIDSLSHEWSGTGGLLSLVDGKFGGWKEATPLHQKLIETIQEANIHIIVTMRSKMEYSQEKDERTGKQVVRKLGMAPVQREQTEYEFDIFAEIEMGSELTISKSRCFALKAGKTFVEGNGLAPVLKQWIAA